MCDEWQGTVIYSMCGFIINHDDMPLGVWSDTEFNSEDHCIEIIGNIHEKEAK